MVAVAPSVTLTSRAGDSIPESNGSAFIDYALDGGTYTSVTSRVWSVTAGSNAVVRVVEFSNAGFAALGNVQADTLATIRYTVTVQDSDGTTDTAHGEVSFTVAVDRRDPNVRIDTVSQAIAGLSVLQLQATDSDTGGFVVSRRWTATEVGGDGTDLGGFVNATVQDARWRAPQPQDDTNYELTITVTDDDGGLSLIHI